MVTMCVQVGNCVAKRNYRFFYLFLCSILVMSVFVMGCNVTVIVIGEERTESLSGFLSVCLVFSLSVWFSLCLSGFLSVWFSVVWLGMWLKEGIGQVCEKVSTYMASKILFPNLFSTSGYKLRYTIVDIRSWE